MSPSSRAELGLDIIQSILIVSFPCFYPCCSCLRIYVAVAEATSDSASNLVLFDPVGRS